MAPVLGHIFDDTSNVHITDENEVYNSDEEGYVQSLLMTMMLMSWETIITYMDIYLTRVIYLKAWRKMVTILKN